MTVTATKSGVTLGHDDGIAEFILPWSEILSIGLMRAAHFELVNEWTRKIIIVPQVGTQAFREWYVWEDSDDWVQWIVAFEEFIPNFDRARLGDVLKDTQDDDTEYICLYLAGDAIQPHVNGSGSEIEEWFDCEYSSRSKTRSTNYTHCDKIFFQIYDLLGEVGNGGFEQYFSNSSGNDWDLAKQSLSKIRAKDTLGVFEQACRLFPRGTPGLKSGTRQNQLKRMPRRRLDLMADLDEQIMDKLEDTLTHLKRFLDRK